MKSFAQFMLREGTPLPQSAYLQLVNAGPSRENILANAGAARMSARYQQAMLDKADEDKLRKRAAFSFLADTLAETPDETLMPVTGPGMEFVPNTRYDMSSVNDLNLTARQRDRLLARGQTHNLSMLGALLKQAYQPFSEGTATSSGLQFNPEDLELLSNMDREMLWGTIGQRLRGDDPMMMYGVPDPLSDTQRLMLPQVAGGTGGNDVIDQYDQEVQGLLQQYR